MGARVIPLDLRTANAFIEEHHRHNGPTAGHKFSIGLEENGQLVGVGIAGRPICRQLDNGRTLELRRICVKENTQNGCSMLIGRLKRIGQLMGYERIITYTLQRESGSSLRAVSAHCVAVAKPSKWDRKGKPRKHKAVYDEPKFRWELQGLPDGRTEAA